MKPPPNATAPTKGSGKPNVLLLLATIKSQANASSNPPPKAYPSTAAMTGFAKSKRFINPAYPPLG